MLLRFNPEQKIGKHKQSQCLVRPVHLKGGNYTVCEEPENGPAALTWDDDDHSHGHKNVWIILVRCIGKLCYTRAGSNEHPRPTSSFEGNRSNHVWAQIAETPGNLGWQKLLMSLWSIWAGLDADLNLINFLLIDYKGQSNTDEIYIRSLHTDSPEFSVLLWEDWQTFQSLHLVSASTFISMVHNDAQVPKSTSIFFFRCVASCYTEKIELAANRCVIFRATQT